MRRSSKSKGEGNGGGEPHPWLEGSVYGPKRDRTAELVRRCVAALLEAREEVSLLSIVAMSKKLDPEGVGVAHTTVLRNEGARACYEEHRAWKGDRRARPSAAAGGAPLEDGDDPSEPRVKPDRDPDRARRRYMQLPKPVLVMRLMAAEQAYVMQREARLQAEEEKLELRLRAEAAEKRLEELTALAAGDP